MQLADVMVTSSRQVGVRRRLLLAKVLVGVVAIFAVGLAIWAAGEGGKRADESEGRMVGLLADTREELGAAVAEEERQRVAQVEDARQRWSDVEAETEKRLAVLRGAVEKAGDKAARYRELLAKIETLEASGKSGAEVRAELEKLREALAAEPVAGEAFARTRGELEALRAELQRIRGANAAFQSAIADYGESVVILLGEYGFRKGADTKVRSCSGTGFVVTPSGHIVTNKHVAQPWLFDAESRRLMNLGWRLDKSQWHLSAWRAGSLVFDKARRYRMEYAFSTRADSLRFVRSTPDRMRERTVKTTAGLPVKGLYHELDVSDLAILKADFGRVVPALPLRVDIADLRQLDPVMVLGFPKGFSLIEGRRAQTSPSLGEVRKVDRSVWVTAPIVKGNSGGPIVDAGGRVIAVAYKGFGDIETVAAGIPSAHILPLLPNGPSLLGKAEEHFRRKRWRAARDALRLAAQRGAPEKACADLRLKLEARRRVEELEKR